MRATLLISTALAGLAAALPASAAEPIRLTLGGYAATGITLRQQSNVAAPTTAPVNRGPGDDRIFTATTDIGTTDQFWEAEVFFQGETKLDGGLVVGVNIQLEAYTSADQIDEHYVYLQGGFGKIIVGAENSAAYLLHLGTPSPSGAFFGVEETVRFFFPFNPPPANKITGSSTFSQLTGDANKLTYISPRFAPGFQFGVSYTPDDDSPPGATAQNTAGIDCKGGCAFEAGNGSSNNDQANQHHFVEAAVNFTRRLNGIDVAFDAGLGYGFLEKQSRSTAGLDRLGKDRVVATTGVTLGYAGFTGGLSFNWDNLGLQGPNRRFDIAAGLTYGSGPWLVGGDVSLVLAQDGQALQGATLVRRSDDRMVYAEIGGSYLLGPGIKLFSVVNVVRWDGNGTDTEESTGAAWSSGVVLNF